MKIDNVKSTGSVVFGITAFKPEVELAMIDRMQKGFSDLMPYSDEFDSAVNGLSNDQKVEYGYIFSNFMYLIRAFTHNDVFMKHVITVIEGVKKLTNTQS